jgi:nitroimidazol reductase NimA-like FMN-containing flavoprotein (pyridoxamine 5'-phosphate oxidase superfamily)
MTASTVQPTRPALAKSYGISRKKEGLLSWDWVEEQMTKANNYWVNSVRPDGRPHTVPVSGMWLDGYLYFSGDRKARRTLNLEANPQASVHLESADDVVIMEGIVEDVTNQDELTRMAHAIGAKFKSEFITELILKPENVLHKLTPQVVFAWIEKDYPNTATRWEFEK